MTYKPKKAEKAGRVLPRALRGEPAVKSTPAIGEFLVRMGQLSTEQAGQVLDQQNLRPYKLFGELAVELGFVEDPTVRGYLTRKSFI